MAVSDKTSLLYESVLIRIVRVDTAYDSYSYYVVQAQPNSVVSTVEMRRIFDVLFQDGNIRFGDFVDNKA